MNVVYFPVACRIKGRIWHGGRRSRISRNSLTRCWTRTGGGSLSGSVGTLLGYCRNDKRRGESQRRMTSALFDDPEESPLGREMKISPAFFVRTAGQFSSHKSVFFSFLFAALLTGRGSSNAWVASEMGAKADVSETAGEVRFVPIADSTITYSARSL